MIRTIMAASALIAALAAPSIYAAEPVKDCVPASYQELVRCLEKSSTEIAISEQQLQTATKLESVASEWVNPDLDIEHVQKGSEKSETTASMLFTIRLGGKRAALMNEARSEFEKAKYEREIGISNSRLTLILSLYRLAHLKSEIKYEEESVLTFSKIVRQFENRSALSPEQGVSSSVFKMAQNDHQLRLAKLKNEEEKVFQFLYSTTGYSQALIAKFLPARKQKWPEVSASSSSNVSVQIKKAEAELKVAQSLKDKADAEAWPDLKIGPAVKLMKDDVGGKETFYGAALSMPLPIFSRNSGARGYQDQKLIEANFAFEQSKRNFSSYKTSLESRYKKLVDSLKLTIEEKSLNARHEQVERQFFKGLVSSSLVIEAHRQLYELEERRNAAELEAIETFGQLLILNNQFDEAAL